MFQWLRRLVWNRRRLIFRFYNGSKVVAVDPITIATALHEHKEYLPKHLEDAAKGDVEAQRIVANTACEVFGVSRFDGYKSGMTVAERIDLMFKFDTYLLALKKNINPLLIPRSFTGLTSDDYKSPTTSVTSDCGPIANEACCEPPTSCNSESTQPNHS
jgi:hypothetical protein